MLERYSVCVRKVKRGWVHNKLGKLSAGCFTGIEKSTLGLNIRNKVEKLGEKTVTCFGSFRTVYKYVGDIL